MPTNDLDNDKNKEIHEAHTEIKENNHAGLFAALATGLILALAGDAYLLVRSNHLNHELAQMRDDSQIQVAKLSDATTAVLEQERQKLQALNDDISGKYDSANSALKRARSDAQKASAQLSAKLDEEKNTVSSEISQLKDATNTATAKLNDDVSGVKTDVGTVRSDLQSTRADLDKTSGDLKRAIGDMGVMSGLIATNSKDLEALRALGERNYFEFNLSKHDATKKVGDVTLTLKKSDPKHNRYTVVVAADDKLVEKKDRTMNEPVQFYITGNRQPYEIVVNQVKKDEVVGYLATPKVNVARR